MTNLWQCRKFNGIWQLPPIQHYFLLALVSPFSGLLIFVWYVYYSARTHWTLLNITLFTESLISAYCRKTVSEKRYSWSQQGSSCSPWNQLTVIRHQLSELTRSTFSSKKSYSFLLRVIFSPQKIKQRLFADKTIYLPGVICFATSLQSVSNRTFNPASQHTVINISLLNTELLSVLLFSHSIYSSFIRQHLNFPLKNSALLHLLLYLFPTFNVLAKLTAVTLVWTHIQRLDVLSFHPTLPLGTNTLAFFRTTNTRASFHVHLVVSTPLIFSILFHLWKQEKRHKLLSLVI